MGGVEDLGRMFVCRLRRCSSPDISKELREGFSPESGILDQGARDVGKVLSAREFKKLKPDQIQTFYHEQIEKCNDVKELLGIFDELTQAQEAMKCYMLVNSASEDDFEVVENLDNTDIAAEIGLVIAEVSGKLKTFKRDGIESAAKRCGKGVDRKGLGDELEKMGRGRGFVEANKQVPARFYSDVLGDRLPFSGAVIGGEVISGDDRVGLVRGVEKLLQNCPTSVKNSGYRVMLNVMSDAIPEMVMEAFGEDEVVAGLAGRELSGAKVQGRLVSDYGFVSMKVDENGKIHVRREFTAEYFVSDEMSLAKVKHGVDLVFAPDENGKYALETLSTGKKRQKVLGKLEIARAKEIVAGQLEMVKRRLGMIVEDMLTVKSLEHGLFANPAQETFGDHKVSASFHKDLVERRPRYETVVVNGKTFSFAGKRSEGQKEGVIGEMLTEMGKAGGMEVVLQNAATQAITVIVPEAVSKGFLDDDIVEAVNNALSEYTGVSLHPDDQKSHLQLDVLDSGSVNVSAKFACNLKMVTEDEMVSMLDVDVDVSFQIDQGRHISGFKLEVT